MSLQNLSYVVMIYIYFHNLYITRGDNFHMEFG
jgi:hypothetical protein